MKKTIILAAAISVFSITSTFAQSDSARTKNPNRSERAGNGQRGNPMADLNLSEDQQKKMTALNDENRKQMEAIRNDASLNDDQKRAKIADLRKANSEKRNAILTPEQQKKWAESMRNWQRDRSEGNQQGDRPQGNRQRQRAENNQ